MNYLNTQTTSANRPGNNLTPEMKTYYDRALIRFASPKLVHAQFGQQKPIPAGSGKTIEFRRFSPLPKALTPLTEGVTPKGNTLNVTTVESTVEQYGDYVTMSDMLTLSAVDSVISETQTVLGDQAGRTLDTVIREKVNAGTNVQYGSGKADRNLLVGGQADYGDNDYLTVAAVKRAVATLKRNNAAPFKDGCYVAIIHPDVANDLTNDPEWKAVKQNVDPEDWYKGAIGKIHGVVFVESTEAKIFRAGYLRNPAALAKGDPETLTAAGVSGKTITLREELTAEDVTYLGSKKIQINGFDYSIASANDRQRENANASAASNAARDAASREERRKDQQQDWDTRLSRQKLEQAQRDSYWNEVFNTQSVTKNDYTNEGLRLDNMQKQAYQRYYEQLLQAELAGSRLDNQLTQQKIDQLYLKNLLGL